MSDERSRHVVVKTWRDRWNPDAGGAEMWLHEVVTRLAAAGWQVTVLTARYPGRPRDEVVEGVRFLRRGGTISQYLLAHVSQARLDTRPDVVLDVFNGVPFLSVLRRRLPVVVVVHHVHREQWRMVFGQVRGRIGWRLEQRAARAQRAARHVTVSLASAQALSADYGIDPDRVTVARNGTPVPPHVLPEVALTPADRRLVSLGRLVPHKRVEVAIEALGAARDHGHEAHLDIVGEGEWRPDLERMVVARGLEDHVTFHGHVDDAQKHALLAAADVSVLASVREGWGIVVTEAASHGVPTVALASAGGTTESIDDGVTGELASDDADLVARVVGLLGDDERRARLGRGARCRADRWSWQVCADVVETTLLAAIAEGDQHRTPTISDRAARAS